MLGQQYGLHTDGRQTGRTFSAPVDRVRVSLFINSTRECSNGSSVLKFQSVAAANLLSPLLKPDTLCHASRTLIHYTLSQVLYSTEHSEVLMYSSVMQMETRAWKARLNCVVINHFTLNNST